MINYYLKNILKAFSYIFHPIFIPIMGCSLFYLLNDRTFFFTKIEILINLIQITILTICIPISIFYFLKSIHKVDDFMISKRSQRKIPLLVQSILIIILIQFGTTEERLPELYYFFLSGFLSTLMLLFLVFGKIKASIHMVGMASLLFFIIGLSCHNQKNYLHLIICFLILCGLVASSRILMKAHTHTELFIGFLCGAFSQFILWNFWL